MKISTTTDTLARKYGDEKAIVKLAQAGFDAMDYSMFIHNEETGVFSTNDFEAYAKKLKGIADAAGIEFGQIHAQMPRPSHPDYVARMKLWDELAKRSIMTAAILECPYVVVHPIIMLERRYDTLYQENFDFNVEYYGKMKPYLQEYGVKVAIENMWHFDDEKQMICPTVCSSAEEINKLCDTLGEEFVACLDIGHAVLTDRTPESMIYALGDRLKVLHVHDNNGYDDTHDVPFNGSPMHMMFPNKGNERKINWDNVIKALKDIHYDGTFSLEADSFAKKFPVELADDAVAFMAKIARYFSTFSMVQCP